MNHHAQALLLRFLASMWEEVASKVLPAGFGEEATKLLTVLVITVYKDEYDFDRSRPVPLIASLSGITRAWLEDFKAVLRGAWTCRFSMTPRRAGSGCGKLTACRKS